MPISKVENVTKMIKYVGTVDFWELHSLNAGRPNMTAPAACEPPLVPVSPQALIVLSVVWVSYTDGAFVAPRVSHPFAVSILILSYLLFTSTIGLFFSCCFNTLLCY